MLCYVWMPHSALVYIYNMVMGPGIALSNKKDFSSTMKQNLL